MTVTARTEASAASPGQSPVIGWIYASGQNLRMNSGSLTSTP
jgi:hypothetical protein